MITRNPADAAGRMLTCMFMALLEGVVFLALTDSGDAYQAKLGAFGLIHSMSSKVQSSSYTT